MHSQSEDTGLLPADTDGSTPTTGKPGGDYVVETRSPSSQSPSLSLETVGNDRAHGGATADQNASRSRLHFAFVGRVRSMARPVSVHGPTVGGCPVFGRFGQAVSGTAQVDTASLSDGEYIPSFRGQRVAHEPGTLQREGKLPSGADGTARRPTTESSRFSAGRMLMTDSLTQVRVPWCVTAAREPTREPGPGLGSLCVVCRGRWPTNGYFTRCGPTETYGYRPRELYFPGTRQSVTGRRLGNNRVDRNDRSREHLPVASVRPLIGSYHLRETGPGRNLPRTTPRHVTVVKLLRVGLSVRFTIRVSTNELLTESQGESLALERGEDVKTLSVSQCIHGSRYSRDQTS